MSLNNGADGNDDAWDAFGSDSDSDSDSNDDAANADGCGRTVSDTPVDTFERTESVWKQATSALALFLSQHFLKSNAQVKLQHRRVLLLLPSSETSQVQDDTHLRCIRTALNQRGIQCVDRQQTVEPPDESDNDHGTSASCSYYDTVLTHDGNAITDTVFSQLVAGGWFVTYRSERAGRCDSVGSLPELGRKNIRSDRVVDIHNGNGIRIHGVSKHAVQPHSSICPWLPSTHSLQNEQQLLDDATTTLSAFEAMTSTLTPHSVDKASKALAEHGYCIIRQVLDPRQCRRYGKAVLDTVRDAAKILKERDRVDIYNPQASEFEPQVYRELSMREDLRLDIRHGAHLTRLRRSEETDAGNRNRIVRADHAENDGFLRGHKGLLDVVRICMNPKDDRLYRGNMGRYNFSGSGPDGSFQDLRVSPVGGIVSFPGAAEQALHADTPHLFESIPDLPAHYVNVFTPGTAFDERVGGTAFVHGSHDLRFTAERCGDDRSDNSSVYPFLVRPCLTLGDVVLFDCRILHFGLANASNDKERPLLYTNATQAWFHDPKNWDDKARIFADE